MIDTLNDAVRLHGPGEVAARLKVAPSSLRRWRSAGEVPQAHHAALRGLAAPPLAPLPPRHKLRGISTMVDSSGRTRAQWIKTAAIGETPEEVLARLLRDLPETVPVRKGRTRAPEGPSRDDLLAVYVLGDAHVGMRAWAPETGADFDLAIAERLIVGAAEDLVARGPRTKRAILLNVGDYFHSDTAHGHTTNGDHSLDLDGRAVKVLQAGMAIFTAMVDATLRHHEHVTVDCRIGNHDGHTSLMLAIALAAHYRNEPRISVPLPVAHRAYHRFGRVLIGTTHGDRARPEDLASIMAAERPEDWGATRHRYFYAGHVHHTQVKEYRGCVVESFRTLAARDAWHAGQGYHSGRDMRRIVLHTDHGEVSRETVSADAVLGLDKPASTR